MITNRFAAVLRQFLLGFVSPSKVETTLGFGTVVPLEPGAFRSLFHHLSGSVTYKVHLVTPHFRDSSSRIPVGPMS